MFIFLTTTLSPLQTHFVGRQPQQLPAAPQSRRELHLQPLSIHLHRRTHTHLSWNTTNHPHSSPSPPQTSSVVEPYNPSIAVPPSASRITHLNTNPTTKPLTFHHLPQQWRIASPSPPYESTQAKVALPSSSPLPSLKHPSSFLCTTNPLPTTSPTLADDLSTPTDVFIIGPAIQQLSDFWLRRICVPIRFTTTKTWLVLDSDCVCLTVHLDFHFSIQGLDQTVQGLSEHVELRLCVKHLYGNWKKKYPGMELKESLWSAARTTTIQGWERAMLRIKGLGKEC
ncbi:hypothetical protein KIW84_011123 [Lathyrus oleraceus]|uniref:Uncharacterized protein n=1 Tax=Pisum sativum TaxID=3888 RepID=A0A9D4YMW9_PEA|nr:hypothetical protein KIW84_011123 [Pisum sativum]